ncbi:hypothetical protein FKM82_023505 [Ascaphus truei]
MSTYWVCPQKPVLTFPIIPSSGRLRSPVSQQVRHTIMPCNQSSIWPTRPYLRLGGGIPVTIGGTAEIIRTGFQRRKTERLKVCFQNQCC